MKYVYNKKWMLLLSSIGITIIAHAQTVATTAPSSNTLSNNPMAVTLLVIAAVLALVIAILSNVFLGVAQWFTKKSTNTLTVLLMLGLVQLPMASFAQDAAAITANTPELIGGMAATTFYIIISVIAVEVLVILMQLYFINLFIRKEKPVVVTQQQPVATWSTWWNKVNSFKPFEKEVEIDLGHNYDGIRELDNSLPRWWLYGFYLTIFIGVIYLYRYHWSHTAPSSSEEFAIAMQHAAEEKERYLAKAANNVDENSVTLLTDMAALEKGKTNFTTLCAACHGIQGQGGVGPNLTDAYWLNGGSINDVFKIIKYGRPEKGMRSWKDDFSPIQMAQIASYIKSLQGSNPPNAKEKQGELFVEQQSITTLDTTKAVTIR